MTTFPGGARSVMDGSLPFRSDGQGYPLAKALVKCDAAMYVSMSTRLPRTACTHVFAGAQLARTGKYDAAPVTDTPSLAHHLDSLGLFVLVVPAHPNTDSIFRHPGPGPVPVPVHVTSHSRTATENALAASSTLLSRRPAKNKDVSCNRLSASPSLGFLPLASRPLRAKHLLLLAWSQTPRHVRGVTDRTHMRRS